MSTAPRVLRMTFDPEPISLRKQCMALDLEKYVAGSEKLRFEDIDFGAFAELPLDRDALRALRYMHDVEFHTICYLRDLLVTRAHKDPEITAFLTFWAYEEYWHGEAIARVLTAHGIEAGVPRIGSSRGSLGFSDKTSTLVSMLASAVFKDFVAVHMTWGAINEWTTQAGYAQLIARSQHPVLAELLRRIMKQEGRHIDVYLTQAYARLAENRNAQRLTRWLLAHKWAPVGSGVMPAAETDFMVSYLFGGEDGLAVAERIDRRIDRIPGLSGMNLITGAVVA